MTFLIYPQKENHNNINNFLTQHIHNNTQQQRLIMLLVMTTIHNSEISQQNKEFYKMTVTNKHKTKIERI